MHSLLDFTILVSYSKPSRNRFARFELNRFRFANGMRNPTNPKPVSISVCQIEYALNLAQATHLSDARVSGVEHRLFDGQQFLQQISVSDRVDGWNDHLEKRSLPAVLEARNRLFPEVHATNLEVHVVTP